jgi:hypothetical protein
MNAPILVPERMPKILSYTVNNEENGTNVHT